MRPQSGSCAPASEALGAPVLQRLNVGLAWDRQAATPSPGPGQPASLQQPGRAGPSGGRKKPTWADTARTSGPSGGPPGSTFSPQPLPLQGRPPRPGPEGVGCLPGARPLSQACARLQSPCPPPRWPEGRLGGLGGPAGHTGRRFTTSPGGGWAGGCMDGKAHPGGCQADGRGRWGRAQRRAPARGHDERWGLSRHQDPPPPCALGPGGATHTAHTPKSGLHSSSEQFSTSAGESLICSQLGFNSQWCTCSRRPWDSQSGARPNENGI